MEIKNLKLDVRIVDDSITQIHAVVSREVRKIGQRDLGQRLIKSQRHDDGTESLEDIA